VGTSLPHRALDQDNAIQKEVRNVARALGSALRLHIKGKFESPDSGLRDLAPE
jgi:hypothetical protein